MKPIRILLALATLAAAPAMAMADSAPLTAPSINLPAALSAGATTTDAPVTTPAITGDPALPGPKLSNFADVVVAGIVGESAPEVDIDFAAGTTIGQMPIAFEKTTLDLIQGSYGGLLHTQGDAGNAVTWLCYTQHAKTKADIPTTVWFISDNEMAGGTDTVSTIVVENVDASKVSGCATASKTFVFPTFGIPSIGASPADLQAKFGALKRDRQHNAYYDSTRPVGDGSGKSVYQKLGYVISKKGTVSGLALSQVTTD